MAKHPDHLAGDLDAEPPGGLLTGFLAEEDEFDRRALWRLGSWGVGAVGAVIIAVMANQHSLSFRRDQIAGRRSGATGAADPTCGEGEPERDAAACGDDRDAQFRPRPALFPRHHARAGTGFRHWRDREAKHARRRPPPARQPKLRRRNRPPRHRLRQSRQPLRPHRRRKQRPTSRLPPTRLSRSATGRRPQRATNPRSLPPTNCRSLPWTPPRCHRQARRWWPPSRSWRRRIPPPAGWWSRQSRESPITATPIPEVVAAAPAADETEAEDSSAPKASLQHTEFGVDLGGANSVGRAARAVARVSEDAGLCTGLRTAPDHRHQGGSQRPWLAASAGCGAAPRRRRGRQNLRRAEREQPTLRDHDLRWPAPDHEGRGPLGEPRHRCRQNPCSAGAACPRAPPPLRRSPRRRRSKPEGTTFSFLFGRKGQ